MNNVTNGLDLVKKLVAGKQQLPTPNVTCGSSDERKWWPPYTVSGGPQQK